MGGVHVLVGGSGGVHVLMGGSDTIRGIHVEEVVLSEVYMFYWEEVGVH